MFGVIRDLVESNRRLRIAILAVGEHLDKMNSMPAEPVVLDQSDLLSRLDDLERSRALWEATMEAELLKAESQYKSARNAESRARTMAASDEDNEGDLPSAEEIAAAYREAGIVPPGDASGGEGDGVQLVRTGVEGESAKASAVRFKFGG